MVMFKASWVKMGKYFSRDLTEFHRNKLLFLKRIFFKYHHFVWGHSDDLTKQNDGTMGIEPDSWGDLEII